MRLFFIFLISTFVSCSDFAKSDINSSDSAQFFTLSEPKLCLDTIPKVLKGGIDYITISASAYDKTYFGDKFSPYKMEPCDIAYVEEAIDSLIGNQKNKGKFEDKSLTDYKYQIFSVRTAGKKLQARVQAICVDQAEGEKWKSSRIEVDDGGDCYFSIIYDLTDKKIISFQINSDA